MSNDISNTANSKTSGFGKFAYLSPIAVIALSFGYAVGWGSFVLPGTVFLPNAGPAGTIIGFLIGTATIIVLAYNFHKVTTRLRGTGAPTASSRRYSERTTASWSAGSCS